MGAPAASSAASTGRGKTRGRSGAPAAASATSSTAPSESRGKTGSRGGPSTPAPAAASEGREETSGRSGPSTSARSTALASAAAGVVDAEKIYGKGDSEVRALDGVTIAFERGHFTAIMGPSGSGKSTLMHCLAGLDSLTSGAVYIGDTYLATLSDKQLTELRRTAVGFIFQAYNLVPTLTALENITLPLLLGGQKGDPAWIDRVVKTVGLGDRLKHRPSELSGGQQQRVAVARALASQPTIIFADEPTGNLDSRTGAEILDFLRLAVRELGQTIVMVTHDPVAASYADRVVFLADGRIVDEMSAPTAERVLDRMKRFGE
ncbi:MAG: ABC transporter ATP-binding protein [Actinobacteria bacterium]|nr:ABC transporter ATP-binding protein [Actinomycetota bacterium]